MLLKNTLDLLLFAVAELLFNASLASLDHSSVHLVLLNLHLLRPLGYRLALSRFLLHFADLLLLVDRCTVNNF